MAEFGTGKSIFILAIVAGCFAVLWPKIFYPMLLTSISGIPAHQSVPPLETSEANLCCDVIFETDVTAIKVLTEMCGHIIHAESSYLHAGHLPKYVIEKCRDEVISTCGLDITAVIKDNVRLTKNYKHILDEIRTYNNSACLKKNFGVQLSLLGTPRQMKLFREKTARHLRPERPSHLHPDMMHPALREKGRAIPQQKRPDRPITVGSVTGLDSDQPNQPRPGPTLMRPPLGGAGHVVPAPKGGGTMGIVMPLYTVGIVIFFVYTIMKVLFKKTDDRSRYPEYGMDPEIRKMMFGAAAMEECATAAQQAATREEQTRVSPEPTQTPGHPAHANGFRATTDSRPSSKLGDYEMDQLRKRLEETEAAMERIVAQMGTAVDQQQKTNATIKTVPRQEEDKEDDIQEEQIYDEEEELLDQDEFNLEEEAIEETPVEAEDRKVEDKDEEEEMDLPETEDVKEDAEEEKVNGHLTQPERTTTPIQQILEEGGGKVTVVGMETTAQCEGGHRWTGRPATPETPPRSNTPILPLYALEQFTPPPPPPPPPHYRWARPPTPPTPPRSITPLSHLPQAAHAYLLETPAVVQGGQHGILVSDSECEALPIPPGDPETETEDEDSPPVILSGKMTLSVISLPEPTPSVPDHSSTPSSPALPRRAMQVAPAEIREVAAPVDSNDADELAKEPEQDANGEEKEVDEEEICNKPTHMSNGVQDDATATNYTTASAAAMEDQEEGERQEETSADISGIDDEHAEAADIDEPAAEVEDLPQDDDETNELHGQSNGML